MGQVPSAHHRLYQRQHVVEAALTTSASTSVVISDCDAPFTVYLGPELNDAIELLPGRKRLDIKTDIADESVGEITLRGPLTPAP